MCIRDRRPGPGFAYPVDAGEGGADGGRLALLPVVPDSPAVHLLLDGGDQSESRPLGIDGDFPAVHRDGAGAVVIVLHHAEHRDAQPVAVHHRLDRCHVSLAAVQQDEIRQPAESGALLLMPVSYTHLFAACRWGGLACAWIRGRAMLAPTGKPLRSAGMRAIRGNRGRTGPPASPRFRHKGAASC